MLTSKVNLAINIYIILIEYNVYKFWASAFGINALEMCQVHFLFAKKAQATRLRKHYDKLGAHEIAIPRYVILLILQCVTTPQTKIY